jgi:hypothetical protein
VRLKPCIWLCSDPATVFQIVRAAVGPGILIIPEIPTLDYYRWTAPLHGEIEGDVKHIWPLTKKSRSDTAGSAGAWAVNLMQNCCHGWNSTTVEWFAKTVAGDCAAMMYDGWWWNPDKNPLVKYAHCTLRYILLHTHARAHTHTQPTTGGSAQCIRFAGTQWGMALPAAH